MRIKLVHLTGQTKAGMLFNWPDQLKIILNMATSADQRPAVKTDNNANQTNHYITLAVAVVIGLTGTFLRFLEDSFTLSMISNVLLLIGWIIVFRTVFRIMK